MSEKTGSALTQDAPQQLVVGADEMATQTGIAEARAEVEARFALAYKFPRDPDVARSRILKDCRRPRFAEDALYAIRRGGTTITGPSIRMVEAMLLSWGNVYSKSLITHEDHEKRKIRNFVTDLERNVTFDQEMIVPKTKERRSIRDGEKPLSTRMNHSGQMLYILPSTPDDVRQLEGAMVSRAIRNNGKRIIPSDILAEAIELINQTRRDRTAEDPDAARKALVDSFASLNIGADDLKEYLGHGLEKCTPAQLDELRLDYVALREGNTTWQELLAEKKKGREAKAAGDAPAAPKDLAEATEALEKKSAKEKKDPEKKKTGDDEPDPEQGALI